MPEKKVQSKEWSPIGAKPPRKAKRTESQKKLMYCLFFDSKGPLYQHFVPKVRKLRNRCCLVPSEAECWLSETIKAESFGVNCGF